MSQYKDTSLKDLLENFINAQYLGAFTENRELEDNAEDEMQAIAGELNRRFYLTQRQNEALFQTLDALIEYFTGLKYTDGPEYLADDLEQIKDKLQGEQP